MLWSTAGVEGVGHRGACQVAPENTMAPFRAARRLGAHGIEFDVQQCADGELVVLHDFTLDRTTNGTGLLANSTSREIGALDAGIWFSSSFRGRTDSATAKRPGPERHRL